MTMAATSAAARPSAETPLIGAWIECFIGCCPFADARNPSELRKPRCEHYAAAAARHEPERSDKLRHYLRHRRELPCASRYAEPAVALDALTAERLKAIVGESILERHLATASAAG